MSSSFTQKVEEIIEYHLQDNNFGIQELANALFISRVQLYRKLMKLEGQSPTTFIRHYRLKKGLSLLQHTSMPIKEIAYEVGFKDPAHFSNAFKELYHISPSELRR